MFELWFTWKYEYFMALMMLNASEAGSYTIICNINQGGILSLRDCNYLLHVDFIRHEVGVRKGKYWE